MKRWRRPKPPRWLARAQTLLDEQAPLSSQSWLRLLESALRERAAYAEALARIAERLTTDEGDAKASADHFGLEPHEVVEMAHDDMIITARIALKPR